MHNCLDAGEGTLGTVTGYHIRSDGTPGAALARNAALFNQFSAEPIGDWGDASMLWSIAGYAGFQIQPAPVPYGGDGKEDYCPEANSNPLYPALRWQKVDDSAVWVKYPTLTENIPYHSIVDIDGDGYPDLLTDPITPDEEPYFKRSAVKFTRRTSTLETLNGVQGPMLLPFGRADSAAITISPRGQDFSTYADVNGDGILDLVTARNDEAGGVPAVRLGDGRGGFGCNASDVACNVAGNGTWLGPAYRLFSPDATAPWPLQDYQVGNLTLFFHDVTGDGLADIVAFDPRPDVFDPALGRVRLWVNVDGRTFRCANSTDCVVATIPGDNQPVATVPNYRVVFTDIDANGTEDFVLLGTGGVWQFSFLEVAPVPSVGPRAPKPGLLTRVRNGVGADTEIVYQTIQELDLAAQGGDPAASDSFVRPWTKHSPQVIPVVTRITTRDTSAVVGAPLVAPYHVDRSRTFQYRDPAYDPWERSFKGFRRVRTLFPSGQAEQTWFWFDACADGGFINEGCVKGSESDLNPGGPGGPNRALVGAAVRVDRFVPAGGDRPLHWLSTTTTQFTGGTQFVRAQGATPDHSVAFNPAVQEDTFLYDSEQPVSAADAIEFPTSRQRAPEQAGRVHLRTTTEFDGAGNVKKVTAFGRIAPDDTTALDTTIETLQLPSSAAQPRCDADWACNTRETLVNETPVGQVQQPLRHTKFDFNATADVVGVWAELFYVGSSPAGLHRELAYGTDAPSTASTEPGLRHLRIFEVDAFGNVIRIRGESGGNLPCTRIWLDDEFQQFPAKVSSYAGSACTGVQLAHRETFDRGLGALTSRMTAAALETVEYDVYGRLAATYSPAPDLGAYATEVSTQLFHHTQAPTSWMEIKRRSDVDAFVTSIEIFNGVGEHVLGFDQADPTADNAPWIARGWTLRNDDGFTSVVRRPALFSGDPYVIANLAQPVSLVGDEISTERDAFGRPLFTYDGTLPTSQYTHLPLELRVKDAEQLKTNGPYAGLESSMQLDGHGRTIQTVVPVDAGEYTTTETSYLGTGEPTHVRRSGSADPGHTYNRFLFWDSFGRLIHNREPNTTNAAGTRGWDYVYDDESRLVGTSDGRGCGKNLYYDALSRLVAEDFSPCLPAPQQAAYSPPDLVTGDGTEAFYRYDLYEADQVSPTAEFADAFELGFGRLVSVSDRGAQTRFNYDSRGRTRRVTKRIARPGVPADALADRYAAHAFKQESQFDLGDRIRTRTTGLESFELTGGGSSFETMDYTARGALRTIGSSYGTLVSSMTYAASGQPLSITYGDRAATKAEMGYDTRDRLRRSRVSRVAAPALWTTDPPPTGYTLPTPDTTQMTLNDLEFSYDDVGNPTTINDSSADYWPPGAKPVSRSFLYDEAYRIKQVDYSNLGDIHEPAFGPEARAGDRRPIAELRGANRVQTQWYATDWQGNVTASDDNESMRFERSLGMTMLNGVGADQVQHGPNQLIDADGLHADYDDAGNLVELTLARPWCWDDMPECSHRFRYDWDEVGQMSRARRWDFSGGAVPAFDPSVAPVWDLSYSYGERGRTLTSTTDAQGVARHTLDVFDTLRISRVAYEDANTDYTVEPQNEVGFVGGVARVFFDRANALPKGGDTYVHVYLNIGDHLGSTAFVIDRDTAEVVERTTHQVYGAIDADFRPDRWGASREEFKFTGKEEDIEVGISYFGARYYNARLGRWMSADPLTIHGLGADLNPYAYVGGHLTTEVDPFGFDGCPPGATCLPEGQPEDVIKGPPRGGGGGWTCGTARPPAHAEAQRALPEQRGADRSADRHLDQVSVGGGRYVSQRNIAKTVYNDHIRALQTVSNATNPIGWAARAVTGQADPLDPLMASESDGDGDVSSYVPTVVQAVVGATAAGRGMLARFAPKNLYAAEGAVTTLDASAIRFSQSSVNGVGEIARSMAAKGWAGAPIDVVRMESGLVTVDNTRLLAAHMTNTPVQAIVRGAGEALPASMAGRFGNATTWGEAILYRIGNQNAAYRSLFPNGSWAVGVGAP